MSDLIDRQAAISAICNACGKIDCDKMDKCEKLQLPPDNSSEFPNNSDTISRQAAIDALDKRFDSIPMEQTTEILLLRKDLRELPSIQPDIDEFLRNKSPKEHREILHWIALRYYPRDSKEVLQAVSNMIRPNTNGGSDDSD